MAQTAPTTVAEFCKLLVRSKLLHADEVKKILTRWKSEAAAEKLDKVDSFRRWTVRQKLISEYQAALLARGHTEGFFLGEYKIEDRLGKGRMAGVYKGSHPSGQVAAIKVLPASRAKEGNLLNRFLREAKLVTQLDHPNLVRAFTFGESKGVHFIAMEYLDGETLAETLERRTRLPVPEAGRLVYQALQGLQQIHLKGMAHRDLKPANLMLVPSPGQRLDRNSTLGATLKIIDIGLGRMVIDEGGEELLTQDGVLLGTPDFMAPEQARDARSADIRADIYSLGCVLYNLLTGQTPFPDTNVINLAMRHARETPRPLKEFVPDAPDDLQQVLNWMMAKDPAQRYPTPQRAAEALEKFADAAPPATAPQPAATAPGAAPQPFVPTGIPADQVPVGKIAKKPGTSPAPALAPDGSIDPGVELVPIPPPPEELEKTRPLTELTRRDVIMLGIGAGGVLGAIVAGYGLSRAMKREEDPTEEQTTE